MDHKGIPVAIRTTKTSYRPGRVDLEEEACGKPAFKLGVSQSAE